MVEWSAGSGSFFLLLNKGRVLRAFSFSYLYYRKLRAFTADYCLFLSQAVNVQFSTRSILAVNMHFVVLLGLLGSN